MVVVLRRVSLALCFFVFVSGCRKPPTSFRLENGLRVDLLPTSRGDKAALAILFDVGADHDPPRRSGMAHLVEHLFAAGRTGKPAQTRTEADYTLYAVEVPAAQIMAEIDGAARRMASPTPTGGDLNEERAQLLAEVATTQERDAMSAAMNQAAEAVRPSRGGGTRGGVAKEIEQITLPEVETFWRTHYGAATARLTIAGRFDVGEISKRVRASFGKVPAAKTPEPRPPSASRVTGTLVMSDAPRALALAVPVPAPKDPLYPAFLVLAARLTASDSPRSWKADFAPLARPDILFVTSTLPEGQPAEAVAARVRAEVNAVVTAPLAPDESGRMLDRFGALLGITPVPSETVAAEPYEAAFAAGRRAQLGLDATALALAARAVTAEQVAAAARLFDAKNSAAVITGTKAP